MFDCLFAKISVNILNLNWMKNNLFIKIFQTKVQLIFCLLSNILRNIIQSRKESFFQYIYLNLKLIIKTKYLSFLLEQVKLKQQNQKTKKRSFIYLSSQFLKRLGASNSQARLRLRLILYIINLVGQQNKIIYLKIYYCLQKIYLLLLLLLYLLKRYAKANQVSQSQKIQIQRKSQVQELR
ncbi:hypothetical protein ABPG72_020231 [Tetrahymena utriculariae]